MTVLLSSAGNKSSQSPSLAEVIGSEVPCGILMRRRICEYAEDVHMSRTSALAGFRQTQKVASNDA